VRRVADELKIVEKRARETSMHISENAEQHFQRGLQHLQQQLLEGGNSLKHLSEELLDYLKDNIENEHRARRGELETLRSSLESESARMRAYIDSLDGRTAKLDESVRVLESGLDQRLSQMASNTLKDARNQLEAVANKVHEELAARSIKVLSNQLDETSGNMKIIQKGILVSVSESLKNQAADTLQTFEQSTQELGQLSVERCRARLTRALDAALRSVNQEFQMEVDSGKEAKQK
jgi:exonuclease VII small subunit